MLKNYELKNKSLRNALSLNLQKIKIITKIIKKYVIVEFSENQNCNKKYVIVESLKN